MVLRCSDRISRVPPYLIRPIMLPIRGYHPYCAAFQLLLVTLMARLVPVRSPLLREYHIDFLSSGYLDVSVPRVCFFNPMYSGQKYLFYLISECQKHSIIKYQVGSPIQRSMDQSLFSAPHGLSQSITSFIASYCQGIHQTPFSRLI